MSVAENSQHRARLRVSEVEKAFVQVTIDLTEILVLDGIDSLADLPGFRIRSHDLHGPLPDVVIEDTGDRYPVLDCVIREAARLIIMVRVRKELVELLPGCEFLLPTSTGEGAVVGVRSRGRTMLSEGPTFWEAYYELWRKSTGSGKPGDAPP